jgi:hypothetical protein
MMRWHDPAGVVILLGGFTGLWLIGKWWQQPFAPGDPLKIVSAGWRSGIQLLARFGGPALRRVGAFTLAWLILSETAVQSWYWAHERNLPPAVRWSAEFPTNETAYTESPLPIRTTRLLRQDFARNAKWQPGDGTLWQATFLSWKPGSTAVYLARNHTPEVCLAAAGGRILNVSGLEHVPAGELSLPVRFYTVGQESLTAHVLFCLWSDRSAAQEFDTAMLDYGSRIGAVLTGQRLRGQRSLEIAVWGIADATEARTELIRRLQKMVRRDAPELAPLTTNR